MRYGSKPDNDAPKQGGKKNPMAGAGKSSGAGSKKSAMSPPAKGKGKGCGKHCMDL